MSAAIQPRIDIADMSDDDWHRVIDTNLSGVFYCSRAVVPHMKSRRRGSIVTFSSGLALQGWASTSAYAATKAGLIGFTKSLAREMAPYRVRANVIHPGITDSPLFTGTKTAEELQFFKKTMGAVGTVADVVQLLMFFLSDASSSLTGLFINRDIILPD
jgi:NAD(P)-dependent dehydrogenase (short-subunit alcohol dehydrogenase family)